jgi:hypothetical protein
VTKNQFQSATPKIVVLNLKISKSLTVVVPRPSACVPCDVRAQLKRRNRRGEERAGKEQHQRGGGEPGLNCVMSAVFDEPTTLPNIQF